MSGLIGRLLRRARRATGSRVKGTKAGTYSDRVMTRLNAGKTHASLGPKLKPGSADRAQRTLDRLIERGLQPGHVLVDYGCGTLRVGALLIDYLEPDRYIGLDIDQRLLDLGLDMLPAGVASEKRPTLRVISPEAIAELAPRRPDWIFSNGVVQHVSPADLDAYFASIGALATRTTTICVKISKLTEKSTRKSPNTWTHALPEVQGAAKAAGLVEQRFNSTSGGTGGWLILQKAQDDRAPTADGPSESQGI